MPLNIKIGSNLNFRPSVRSGNVGQGAKTSSFSRPNTEGGMPRAQNFSVSRLSQQKNQEKATVSINRVMASRLSGGASSARVGVSDHHGQLGGAADRRAQELETIRNKAIERQKFVTTRHLVKERMARELDESKKAAAQKPTSR